jgi:hypothetical protein
MPWLAINRWNCSLVYWLAAIGVMQQRIGPAASPDRHHQGIGDELAVTSDMAAAPPLGSDRCPLLANRQNPAAEASVRLGTRRQRFGQSHGDACFVAREDLRDIG